MSANSQESDPRDVLGRLKKGHQAVETSLEVELTALEGESKAEFLRFLRRMLQWDADKRPSAQELLKDPWLVISQDDSESEGEA
jgi:serine/threonine protein kinase